MKKRAIMLGVISTIMVTSVGVYADDTQSNPLVSRGGGG